MLIPIFSVKDMAAAIDFHTRLLDFERVFGWPEDAPIYVGLTRGANELHLSLAHEGSKAGHGAAMIVCDDVDALFATFKARGFTPPVRPESPVHEAPLDQTWGTREIYIDDPIGNTLIFQQR